MQLTPEVWLSLGQAHRAGGRTERPGAVQAITGQSRQAGAVRGSQGPGERGGAWGGSFHGRAILLTLLFQCAPLCAHILRCSGGNHNYRRV